MSERVAIARAIEDEIGNRQGQRTDQLVPNLAQVPPGEKTRDLAATKAGFTHSTYAHAKNVLAHGTPALIESMDSGQAAISTAAEPAWINAA